MLALSSVSEVTLFRPSCTVRMELNNRLLEPNEVIEDLASRRGSLDIYCWYEGPQGLPQSAAILRRDFLFQPLLERKRDATFCLYCLKGWDFAKPVSKLTVSPLSKAIQAIDSLHYRCLYATSFFKDCAQRKPASSLYQFANEEMPKKSWLADLSSVHKPRQKSVAKFFDEQSSLFDAIGELDVNHAYSYMQYMEG